MHTFEFTHFKINFQMKGISAVRGEESPNQDLDRDEDVESQEEAIVEEDSLKEEKAYKKMPWEG